MAPTDDSRDDSQAPEDAVALDLSAGTNFVPPSVITPSLLSGASYTHFSPVPPALLPTGPNAPGPACCLGVDEAGRGPVLGPMVYGVFYLPAAQADALLRARAHRFDDSKVLSPAFRAALMATLCAPSTPLHAACGWATAALSARDIGAGMLRPAGAAGHNLNAQALDATAALVRGVLDRGVNVRAVFVDTVGPPAAYQRKLERLFPGVEVTVAKKADSLYPCVSAASVCAKVTRDVALEVLYAHRGGRPAGAEAEAEEEGAGEAEEPGWGSGYPSDGRCVAWMRRNMHPVFGWGPECRFSWGTAKDMLEAKANGGVKVEWPVDDDDENGRMTDFFVAGGDEREKDADELGAWFGTPVGLEAF